jgi:hypothetical protein
MNRDVAICGDCLRVWPAHPTNKGKCEKCGGGTCSCQGCMAILKQLEGGEFYLITGMEKHIAIAGDPTTRSRFGVRLRIRLRDIHGRTE